MAASLFSTGSFFEVTSTGTITAIGSNPATVVIFDNGTTGTSSVNLVDLQWSEQPTGAQVTLIASGTGLTVNGAGVPYQVPMSGSADTPPLYMYLNSRIVA